jgi:hypothetical protein
MKQQVVQRGTEKCSDLRLSQFLLGSYILKSIQFQVKITAANEIKHLKNGYLDSSKLA